MPLTRTKLGAIAAGALVAAALAFVLADKDDGEGGSCGDVPAIALTPPGSGPAAFTMGLRVNDSDDVAAIESALGSRILPRDVFVINTEYAGSDPAEWDRTLSEVKSRYPCNRIASLNGLGPKPDRPGYMFALTDEADVDAILLDWEPDTWSEAGQGEWNSELEANLGRIDTALRSLSSRVSQTKAHMGLVPDYVPPWDYGRTARVIADANRELDPDNRGFQVVQTQPNCGTPAAPGPLIGPLTGELRRQYGLVAELVSTAHLGFEISFDTSPHSGASEAVDRIGPAQAAACSQQVLAAGGAGILYWATPESMRAMLETPFGHRTRPAG